MLIDNHDCLLNRLYRRRSKETPKLRVTGLCAGNSPVTGEFPTQMTSNADNVSIWWSHHGIIEQYYVYDTIPFSPDWLWIFQLIHTGNLSFQQIFVFISSCKFWNTSITMTSQWGCYLYDAHRLLQRTVLDVWVVFYFVVYTQYTHINSFHSIDEFKHDVTLRIVWPKILRG